MGESPEIVTILADSAFDFPDPSLFDEIEKEGSENGSDSGRGARMVAAFKALLNVLALDLSPHGSMAIIQTQVDQICRRFRKYADAPRMLDMQLSGENTWTAWFFAAFRKDSLDSNDIEARCPTKDSRFSSK